MRQCRAVGAHMFVIISQVDRLADEGDIRALRPSLADTGVQNRHLNRRVCADQQNFLCGIKLFDRRRPNISATVARRQLGVVGAAFNMATKTLDHGFQSICGLGWGKIANEARHLLAAHRSRRSAQRLGPAGFAQLTVFANIGRVQPLAAQAVPHETGLVGNPKAAR